MMYSMYSVRDALTGFMTPVLEHNDPVAVRNFSMACDRIKADQSVMAWRPSDFALYRIAEFNSETGELRPLVPPVLVCNGDSVGGDKRA